MDAIILAGGFGTRLQATVPNLPKVLAPINEVPFLDILLRYISQFKCIDRIIFALGYRAEIILEYVQHVKFPFVIESSVESEPLGTGGAVKLALKKARSKNVAIFNGDSYFAVDLNLMLKAHEQWNAELTVACSHVQEVERFGSITLDGARITAFREKNASEGPGWINGGIYLFDREVELPRGSAFSLEKDFFPQVLNKRIFGYCSSGQFIDIGTKESYTQAQGVFT